MSSKPPVPPKPAIPPKPSASVSVSASASGSRVVPQTPLSSAGANPRHTTNVSSLSRKPLAGAALAASAPPVVESKPKKSTEENTRLAGFLNLKTHKGKWELVYCILSEYHIYFYNREVPRIMRDGKALKGKIVLRHSVLKEMHQNCFLLYTKERATLGTEVILVEYIWKAENENIKTEWMDAIASVFRRTVRYARENNIAAFSKLIIRESINPHHPCGWLTKGKVKRGKPRFWKRRWYLLLPDIYLLKYFSNPPESWSLENHLMKGFIFLAGCTVQEIEDPHVTSSSTNPTVLEAVGSASGLLSSSQISVYQIQISNKKSEWHIAFETEDEKRKMMAVLQETIDQANQAIAKVLSLS